MAGGAISGSGISLINSILLGNTQNNGECDGSIVSNGSNIIGVSKCAGSAGDTTDLTTAGILGGQTGDGPGGLHYPLVASATNPAVNKVGVEKCPLQDQLGQPRNGACDIGAVEAKPFCGDKAIDPTKESCDDGNAINTDACPNNCQLATCGNGTLQSGEACDDGNTSNADACTNNCTKSICGDGIVATGKGEKCDDGNGNNTDACPNVVSLTLLYIWRFFS